MNLEETLRVLNFYSADRVDESLPVFRALHRSRTLPTNRRKDLVKREGRCATGSRRTW